MDNNNVIIVSNENDVLVNMNSDIKVNKIIDINTDNSYSIFSQDMGIYGSENEIKIGSANNSITVDKDHISVSNIIKNQPYAKFSYIPYNRNALTKYSSQPQILMYEKMENTQNFIEIVKENGLIHLTPISYGLIPIAYKIKLDGIYWLEWRFVCKHGECSENREFVSDDEYFNIRFLGTRGCDTADPNYGERTPVIINNHGLRIDTWIDYKPELGNNRFGYTVNELRLHMYDRFGFEIGKRRVPTFALGDMSTGTLDESYNEDLFNRKFFDDKYLYVNSSCIMEFNKNDTFTLMYDVITKANFEMFYNNDAYFKIYKIY